MAQKDTTDSTFQFIFGSIDGGVERFLELGLVEEYIFHSSGGNEALAIRICSFVFEKRGEGSILSRGRHPARPVKSFSCSFDHVAHQSRNRDTPSLFPCEHNRYISWHQHPIGRPNLQPLFSERMASSLSARPHP